MTLKNLITFCFVFTTLTLLNACGQNRNIQSENPTGWKTFEQRDFIIQYPEDSFELNTSGQMGMSFMLLSKQTSPDGMFRTNINLLIQDLRGHNISLYEFVEISEIQANTMVTDGKLIESKRFQKDNSEFHKLIYTGRQGMFELKWKQ